MIYHLFQSLKEYDIPGQGLMTYLSFRAIFASITAMLVAVFALLVGGSSVLYHLSPFGMDWYLGAPSSLVIMGCIGCVLLFGVPLFYIGSAIATSLFHTKPLPDITSSLLSCSVGAAKGNPFLEHDGLVRGNREQLKE